MITEEDIKSIIQDKANYSIAYEKVRDLIEPIIITTAMEITNRNQTKSAKLLGINRGTFAKKLKKYGLSEVYYACEETSMKPDIKQLRILFTEKDICLPLRHCDADDISVNWEIDSIVKNRGFFESLYSDYPLTGVYDRDTFWYYFLTEKISGMSGLCNYLDNDDAELLRLLSRQAGDALSKMTPEVVQYIKKNAEEIFSEPEQDSELQYSAVDFIIRNQKDFITRTQEGISSPVFETLCRRQPHLIVSRFVDLRQIFTDYPELFSLLFRDGSLKDILDIGLGDVLDAWREEFSEVYSPFRSLINRYADRLCDEAESFYESSSSEGKILKAVSILRAVRLFLKQIHHERVREFARYTRDAEQKLLY